MSTRTTRTTKRVRSKAPEAAPVPVADATPARPPYARGNPLTHSVTFSDSAGTCWLVYVEPAPPEPALWPNAAIIPGRRLRFDSVDRSVTASPFPAGAPFLHERALQTLLDRAQSASPQAPAPRDAAAPARQRRMPGTPPTPPPPVPELTLEPVRQQLTGVVSSHGGLTYRLSRLAQPFALVLMVIRDMILPRGRG